MTDDVGSALMKAGCGLLLAVFGGVALILLVLTLIALVINA